MHFAKLVKPPRRPALQITNKPSLLDGVIALGTSVLTTGAIAVSLSLIAIAVVHWETETDLPPVQISSVTSEETPPAEKAPCLTSHTPPSAPQLLKIISAPDATDYPTSFTPPIPQGIPEFDPLTELSFDNPFAKPAPAVKPKARTSKAKKSTKPKSKRTVVKTDPGKVKRAAVRKQAALAKKIVKPAVLISQVKPSYPRSARRKKAQGKVVVTVTVGTSGRVTSCFLSQQSKSAALNAAALKAARKHRFRPARNGLGQAVPSQKKIPFYFQLRG